MESQKLLPLFTNEETAHKNKKHMIIGTFLLMLVILSIGGGVFLFLHHPKGRILNPNNFAESKSNFNMTESCEASNASVIPVKSFENKMMKILFLGDSLTEQGAYPGGFISRLITKYRRQIETVIRGFSGYTTTDIIEYLPDILSNVHVDVTFILLGTNDAKFNNSKQFCLLDYENNMNYIIDQVLKISPLVYLITPPPCRTINFDNNNGFLREHTKRYTEVVKKIGNYRQMKVIDTFEFIDPAADLYDGIHFNGEGAEKLYHSINLVLETHNLSTFLPMIY